MLLSAFMAAVSQLLLKKSANREHKNKLFEYLNFYVITGYLLLVLTLFMNMWAFQGVPYKLGPVLNAASYVFVMLLSRIFLKERVTRQKAAGMFLIVLGIIVFGGTS